MRERLQPIFDAYRGGREVLVPVLQKAQAELGYLSEEAISEIARFLGLSSSDIYGVASFYSQFRFERPGEHEIKVCQGTACHVRGSGRILDEVQRELGVGPGGTTDDYKFSLERVACVGCCALAPVMVVDNVVHAKMTVAQSKKLLAEY